MAPIDKAPSRRPQLITRRRTLLKGLASLGGVVLGGCVEESPPTYGNILRMGDVLTYEAHRLLLPRHTLAKEYARADITSIQIGRAHV